MNTELLCKSLEITSEKLKEFIEEGLPFIGTDDSRQFDEDQVVHWLISQGKAEPIENIVPTAAEACKQLDVTHQQMSTWQTKEGFPGRRGYFPLDEIIEWMETRPRPGGQRKTREEQPTGELSISDQLRQVRLQKAQETLIDIEEVEREFHRTNSHAVSELHNLAGKIESLLPSGLPQDVQRSIREAVTSTVDEVCKVMQELITGEEEEGSDEEIEP